jgi:hypothetical protein
MLLLHILGGLIGLASGAVALSASKGGRLHRKSGTIFVYAMSVLSMSGAIIAALIPERISVMAGLLTFYLVLTGLLTVRRGSQGSKWMDVGAMFFGLTVSIIGVIFGVSNLTGEMDELPPALAFVFGAVAFLAVLGDARVLLARSIPWAQRIARHLWRMCLAMWIATASFFLGQAEVFPESVRIMPLLCTPVLLVMLLMVYWLVRVLFTRWRPQA